MRREEKTDQRVKSIVRLRDMNFEREPGVRDPKDTNGKRFEGPFNPDGPTDVAALHHCERKSHKECVAKK
jgi:hypothetical protein